MTNYFIILLNRTMYSPNATDFIHTCTFDIYLSLKYYTGQLANYNASLSTFVHKYCSIANLSDVASHTLPQVIIYPLHNTTDVIKFHNNTYSEYERFNQEEHTICVITIKDADNWGLMRLNTFYRMICESSFSVTEGICASSHNPSTIYNIGVTLDTMYKAFCRANQNILILERNISETTALLQNQNRMLEERNKFLERENSELRFELIQVTQERDALKQKVIRLEADKMIFGHRIEVLTRNLTIVQNSEKELQVKLHNIDEQLKKATHSAHIASLILVRLRDNATGISSEEVDYNKFVAQNANYTRYQNTYTDDKKLISNSLNDTQQNIELCTQEIKSLQFQLLTKEAEVEETKGLLNITLGRIDEIYNTVTKLNKDSQNVITHKVAKRNINNRHSEASDDYAARITESEQKVQEIFTILESIEKKNNIFKSQIPQNEEKEIEYLPSDNLSASNLIFDVPNSFSISDENINYNQNQGDIMGRDLRDSTTNKYDAIINRANEHATYIINRLNQGNNKPANPLPEDYPTKVDPTNKLINNITDNPSPITIGGITVGGIALGAVALYCINKYCFLITKWPIMAYKYITKSCRTSDTQINDNVNNNEIELTNVAVDEEDSFSSFDSFDEDDNGPNPSIPHYINVINEENEYEVPLPDNIIMTGQTRLEE